jgi:hypothetical protein
MPFWGSDDAATLRLNSDVVTATHGMGCIFDRQAYSAAEPAIAQSTLLATEAFVPMRIFVETAIREQMPTRLSIS